MGKYGKENERESKRIAKKASQEKVCWERPAGATFEPKVFRLNRGNFQLTQREVRLEQNGMLVEFALIVSEWKDGESEELLCIDSCHDESVHRHLNNHSQLSVVKELLFDNDLQAGFEIARTEAMKFYDEKSGAGHD